MSLRPTWKVPLCLFAALIACSAVVGSSAKAESPPSDDEASTGAFGKEIEQLQTLIPAGLTNRQEQHEWQRFVRYFRQGHHFGLSVGHGTNTWNVDSYGAVNSAKYPGTSWDATFTYAYFLPLYRKLGYSLGTSFGTARHVTTDPNFTPPAVTKYPGISVGLAYAPHPGLRFGGMFAAYLERWEGIRAQPETRSADSTDGTIPAIHMTTETVDIAAFCDVFFSLSWALRFETHEVRNFFIRPREPHGAMDSKISRQGRLYGAGIIHHLL